MTQSSAVLIVDDEDVAREGLVLALEGQGYRLLTAASGVEALRIMDEDDVDVVLTDLRMPGMDGMDLLERIKAGRPTVEVIVVTGFASVDTAVDAWKKGAFDYVCKPYDLDAVRRTVLQALDQHAAAVEYASGGLPAADGPAIVAHSPAMGRILSLVRKVAPSRSTVLVTGESGVGKELIARALHALGPRGRKRFLPFNCAARAESLLESELFGYEKGAFTGAERRTAGIFERAAGGTVFLDEVGEIPLLLQVKLLRVVQERELLRLGGAETVAADFRLVAATNRDLESEVKAGRFREDLYYRLNVITIEVPPLRERPEDVLPLARNVLLACSRREGRHLTGFTAEAEDWLLAQPWQGNVRELQNAVERAVILTGGPRIELVDLREEPRRRRREGDPEALESLADVERRHILEVMDRVGGNRSRAARILGLDRSSLWRKLKQYDETDC